MKISTLLKSIIVIGVFLINNNINAQSEELQKLVDDPDNLWGGMHYTYGIGQIKKWQIKKGFCIEEDYKVPKKVGLITFYIKDDDYRTYDDIFVTSHKATQEKVNVVAQRIYEQCIDDLKKEYADLGMELLTPFEFIAPIDSNTGKRVIDEDKYETYVNFPLPILEKQASKWSLGGDQSAVAEKFRLLPYNNILISGAKFAKEKEEYFLAMGMDAYLAIGIDMTAAGEGDLQRVSAIFYYKNPAFGTKTTYGAFAENPVVNLTFKPTIKGIYLTEEQEYTNKKGKIKTKQVPIDMDPNIGVVVKTTAIAVGHHFVNTLSKSKK